MMLCSALFPKLSCQVTSTTSPTFAPFSRKVRYGFLEIPVPHCASSTVLLFKVAVSSCIKCAGINCSRLFFLRPVSIGWLINTLTSTKSSFSRARIFILRPLQKYLLWMKCTRTGHVRRIYALKHIIHTPKAFGTQKPRSYVVYSEVASTAQRSNSPQGVLLQRSYLSARNPAIQPHPFSNTTTLFTCVKY